MLTYYRYIEPTWKSFEFEASEEPGQLYEPGRQYWLDSDSPGLKRHSEWFESLGPDTWDDINSPQELLEKATRVCDWLYGPLARELGWSEIREPIGQRIHGLGLAAWRVAKIDDVRSPNKDELTEEDAGAWLQRLMGRLRQAGF